MTAYLDIDVPLWLVRAFVDMKDGTRDSIELRDPIPSLIQKLIKLGIFRCVYYAGSDGYNGAFLYLTSFGKEYVGVGMRKGVCFVRVLLGVD